MATKGRESESNTPENYPTQTERVVLSGDDTYGLDMVAEEIERGNYIRRFEDLVVWQKARALTSLVYSVTREKKQALERARKKK